MLGKAEELDCSQQSPFPRHSSPALSPAPLGNLGFKSPVAGGPDLKSITPSPSALRERRSSQLLQKASSAKVVRGLPSVPKLLRK